MFEHFLKIKNLYTKKKIQKSSMKESLKKLHKLQKKTILDKFSINSLFFCNFL